MAGANSMPVQTELEPAGTLPPGVRGAQRGELLLSIDELALAAPWASGACGVRIKWWGEPGDGTVLLPSQPGCAPQTPTGYAINCGPEQLARYLADMRVLVLDVLDLAAPAPHALGHAYLHLSEAHFGAPLCETLAVYTEAEEELAQLRVSLLVRFAPGAGASLNSSVELPSRLPHRLSSRPLPLRPLSRQAAARRRRRLIAVLRPLPVPAAPAATCLNLPRAAARSA